MRTHGNAIRKMRSECKRNYFKDSDEQFMPREEIEILNDMAFEIRERKRNAVIQQLENRVKELEKLLEEERRKDIEHDMDKELKDLDHDLAEGLKELLGER